MIRSKLNSLTTGRHCCSLEGNYGRPYFSFPDVDQSALSGLINSAGNRTDLTALGVDDVLKDNAKYGFVGIVQSLTYITLITDNVLFVYSPRHL